MYTKMDLSTAKGVEILSTIRIPFQEPFGTLTDLKAWVKLFGQIG